MLAVLAEHRGFVIRKMPLRYGTRELNSMTEGIMMELDEAISHALEVTRQNEDSAILYKNCKEIKRNTYEVLTAEAAEQKCLSCAAEHRQLAEWLKELKEAMRLLKMAVEDLEKIAAVDECSFPYCDSRCPFECIGQCEEKHWKHLDEALKLIGDESNK
jgi:hypothetical protein